MAGSMNTQQLAWDLIEQAGLDPATTLGVVLYPDGSVGAVTRPRASVPGVCMDCDQEPEDYMVHNRLWYGLVRGGEGRLCLDCLANRLGRPLTREDLTDAPINEGLEL